MIKDEDNFIILTNYGSLRFYKKEDKNYIFKNEIINEKLVSDMVFDNSKNTLFCIAEGFIKVFQDIGNGNYSKIKEINVPEFKNLFNNNNPLDGEPGFEAGGYNNKILLFEDKNILIVKELNSISFFNISDNYKLINIYKENELKNNLFSIDRYDEDKIIVIFNLKSLKVISLKENKVVKFVKEINKEKYVDFRIIRTYPEKNIIILGGSYGILNSLGVIIQVLRLDNFETIQIIKIPEHNWINGIYLLKKDLIATIFHFCIKLWNI